ncbi:fungal pheromone STE3G-protein-coupled receptor, partial [Gloeophyllum trabeum ATCC 11539]
FSILSFFSFVLAIIPFSWQAEAWNTGVFLYMAWTAVQSLNVFINSVLWRNNAINWSPVWCDISTRIYIGTNVAIPLVSFCINRTLNQIITRPLSISKDTKKRRLLIDLAIGLGLPILEIVLSYIVQGHRFDILEEIGCWPAIYNTPPTFALVYCWPLVISTLTSVYSVLTVRALLKSRSKTLGQYTVLSRHRLSRLLALASLEAIVGLPVSAYFLSINADEINPWVSWSDTHFNFSRLGQIPSLLWRSDSRAVLAIELSRWNIIICSFLFFAFFGLAEEAIARYRDAFRYILSRL